MNKVYRVVWRATSQSWVVVSELVSSRKKSASAAKRSLNKPSFKFNWLAQCMGVGLLLGGAIPAHAVVLDWTGNAGNNLFDDPGNWAQNIVPDYGYQANINTLPKAIMGSGSQNWADVLNVGSQSGSQGIWEIRDVDWFSAVAPSINVGAGGGTGTLSVYKTATSNLVISSETFNLGAGQNSNGVFNVLGSGKNSPDFVYTDALHLRGFNLGSQLYVGAAQGQGVVNIEGGTLTAENIYVKIGSGAGSVGTVNILSSGKFVVAPEVHSYDGDSIYIGHNGGSGSITLNPGSGSLRNQASFQSGLTIGIGGGSHGQINILGGGKIFSSTGNSWDQNPSLLTQLGVGGGTGKVVLDGTDSTWLVAGDYSGYYDQFSEKGELYLAPSGTGKLILGNDSEVFVGVVETVLVDGSSWFPDPIKSTRKPVYNQTGPVYMATQAGAVGVITLGSDPDQQIGGASVGRLVAEKIVLGEGAAWINFNHNQNLHYSNLLPVLDSSKQGGGTLNLGSYAGTTHLDLAQPSFKGFTDLYGGTLWVDDANALGASVIRGRYHVGAPAGGTLGYSNGLNLTNAMQLQADAMLSLRVDGSDSATHAGSITGEGDLLKVGDGSLHLTGTTNYNGITRIMAGVLALEGDSSLANSAAVMVDGTFDISQHNGAGDIKTLSGAGDVLLGNNNLNITAGSSHGANSGVFTGVISGGAGLNVSGGVQLLGGANTWQGTTTVASGATLAALAHNTFSPNASYTVANGGNLLLNAFDQQVDTLNNAGWVKLNLPDAISTFRRTSFRPTTLTVTGTNTYNGEGGTLVLRTQLGSDTSPTDKLVVNGNTTGVTHVLVRNAGGLGAATTKGIEVVQVGGKSNGQFLLAAPVEAGAFEYELLQGDHTDPSNGNWYLSSSGDVPGICPDGLPGPCDGTDPDPEPNYRSEVANVVAAQSANMEQGMAMLATLHQRIGGAYDLKDEELLAWSRLYNTNDRSEGNRFNYRQRFTGLQLGHDLWVNHSAQGLSQRAGVSIDYTNASADFADQARARKGQGRKHTGSMDTNTVSAGGYYTLSAQDGSYLDTVAMVSHLRNGFKDIYDDSGTQTGWRAGVSAEVGMPVASFAKTWKLEPQAQLSFQHTWYDGFDDEVSEIDSYHVNTLRGRVGLRLLNDLSGQENSGQLYVTANVLHDFIKPTKVDFNGTRVRDEYDKTSAEVGVGGRIALSANASLFGDARYRQSFGGDTHSTMLNLGVQIDF